MRHRIPLDGQTRNGVCVATEVFCKLMVSAEVIERIVDRAEGRFRATADVSAWGGRRGYDDLRVAGNAATFVCRKGYPSLSFLKGLSRAYPRLDVTFMAIDPHAVEAIFRVYRHGDIYEEWAYDGSDEAWERYREVSVELLGADPVADRDKG